jgi:AcrR family transcriptional regulator
MPDITAPRRQQAEERREQILDAALRVFSEKGYAGASIRDIAREVGVTEGLLYHYFESKDQLMQACWQERSWHAHLERILARAEGVPLADILREMIHDFMQTLRKNGPMVRMCATEMQRNPEMAAGHKERVYKTQGMFCDFLRARQAAGEIRSGADVEVAAGLLMGCGYSTFLIKGEAEEAEWEGIVTSLMQNGVDVILHGISARRGD